MRKRKTLAACVGVACATIVVPFVSGWESGGQSHLVAYRDIVGVWTICDGITRGVTAGQIETAAGCLARREEELVAHAEPVLACTPGLRNRPHQLAAAVSLTYNIGPGAYCRSTVARRFNAGDLRGACDAFLRWDRAGGRVIRGLSNRRAAERRLCLTGLAA